MLTSYSQCSRDKMGEIEDDRLRTVDCLRGRLLAERVASKAAEEEAENLAKRLEELERKLDEETKCRKRSEKRLKLALKKLEPLKILVLQGSSTSALSSQYLAEEKPGSVMVDSGKCGSPEVVKEMLNSLSSEDFLADDTSGSSIVYLHHQSIYQDEGSWGSIGTAQSHNKEEPCEDETNKDIDAQQSLTDDVSLSSGSIAKSEMMTHQADSKDDRLAIVPASMQLNLKACKPEVKDVQGVLDALRNVKKQLLYSMGILVSQGTPINQHFAARASIRL